MMGSEREEFIRRRPTVEEGARMVPAAGDMPGDSEIGNTQLADAFMSPLTQIGMDPVELPSFRPLIRRAVARNGTEQRPPAQRPGIEIRHWTDKRIEPVQATMSALPDAAVPNDWPRHSGRFRGAVLAGIFVLGVSGGIGGVYLMQIPEIADVSYTARDQVRS